jgi:hypothetical protein
MSQVGGAEVATKNIVKVNTEILPAGIERAIHVFVPSLQSRFDDPKAKDKYCMAVRSKDEDGKWSRMRLYRKINWNGPTRLVEHFDKPMPGTKGRGVCIVYTSAALYCTWDAGKPKPRIIHLKEE